MSKYIKLEHAINKMDEWFCEPYTPTELLSVLPTIDIVHCKDCKHRYDDGWLEPWWTCTYLQDMRVKDDDFCSYGERIDNE